MENSAKCYFKKCFVPSCKSTNKKTPEKLFVFVPKDEDKRRKWFFAAKRPDEPNLKTNYYCCQDHFNVRKIKYYRIVLNKWEILFQSILKFEVKYMFMTNTWIFFSCFSLRLIWKIL